ncbi:MAG: thioredoxin [Phycisphaeraceae bacterium]|nr:thioredoxin [Phycisphaeraceae bacterium]
MKIKKRELIEWAVLIVVGGTLYLTGLHTEVIGQLQRIVLSTGIISPEIDQESTIDASYQFYLEDFEGKTIPFTSFEGKTVFLNFWATWCPPCIAEMPDIHNLFDQVGNEVQFVMISLDKDREKAKAFVKKKGYSFPTYFLSSPLPSVYDPSAIPTTYVISPQGEIKATHHGMAKYNTDDFKAFLSGL